MRRLLTIALLSTGCASLLGIEDRVLDTQELTEAGYEGCEPENRECEACTSEWHRCVCEGWNDKSEAELRLECAGSAPEAIRAEVVRAAEAEYEDYLEAQGADDDTADDDTADDDAADDDAADDDAADDDAADPLSNFNEDYCGFQMLMEPPPSHCEGCFCGECGAEIQDCLADPGCTEIMDCTLGQDCDPLLESGPGSCYTQATCRGIVDDHGGQDAASYGVFREAIACRADALCPCSGDPIGCTPEQNCQDCLGCWDDCGCNGDALATCKDRCGDPACRPADGCSACTDCVDQCLCEGGNDLPFCVQSCGAAAADPCTPTGGCSCGDCMSDCLCTGESEAACSAACEVPMVQACASADGCEACTTCEGTCTCGGEVEFGACLSQCDSALSCEPGMCTSCSSCQLACECDLADPFACMGMCQGLSCGTGLSPCDSCSCTNCPTAFALCREIPGCPELMACLEATQCLNLDDCSAPEQCEAPLQGLDPSGTGVAEALLSCRLDAQCACFEGPPTITCGDVSCSAYQPEPPNPIAQACCGGETGDRCGIDPAPLFGPDVAVLCAELNQPGEIDESCPVHVASGLPWDGATLSGCCREDGTCGVLDDVVGLGCMERRLFGDESELPPCGP